MKARLSFLYQDRIKTGVRKNGEDILARTPETALMRYLDAVIITFREKVDKSAKIPDNIKCRYSVDKYQKDEVSAV